MELLDMYRGRSVAVDELFLRERNETKRYNMNSLVSPLYTRTEQTNKQKIEKTSSRLASL